MLFALGVTVGMMVAVIGMVVLAHSAPDDSESREIVLWLSVDGDWVAPTSVRVPDWLPDDVAAGILRETADQIAADGLDDEDTETVH